MTWTAVGGLNPNDATGTTSFSLTPTATGDLMVVVVTQFSNATVFATGLSSSNVTWDSPVGHVLGTAQGSETATLFTGKVTAASVATVTITWSGTTPANVVTCGRQFHSTAGAWSADTSAGLNSASTLVWPTLTPSGTGELYAGFALDNGVAVGGSTSGYVYTVSATSNGYAYNLNVSAASAPTWGATDGGQQTGMMALIAEGAPPVGTPQPPQYLVYGHSSRLAETYRSQG